VFLAVAVILGGVPSVWGILAIPAVVLGAAAFAAPLNAYAVTQESDIPFAVIMRMGVFPLFLFSGTFFPTSRLPDWLEPVSALSPLWHAVELSRAATTGAAMSAGSIAGHVAFLVGCVAAGCWWGFRRFARALTS
jgi:lipooligosaccharide transport system permease protein